MSKISLDEFFVAHFNYWKNFLKMLVTMKRTYRNSSKILFKMLKNDYPIKVQLQNKKNIVLETYQGMYFQLFIKKYNNIKIDLQNDIVEIQTKNYKKSDVNIKFFGGVNNGDIINGFLGDDYSDIQVRGKTIIDIGANIGDTPIYFIFSGAERVIGVEPFPRNFELAQKNIENNNMTDKVKIINAGCASKKGFIRVDPNVSDTTSTINEDHDGKKIPLITIEDIINENNIPKNSILKIDCEGCEYDIIMNLSEKVFDNFTDIFIEYHNGYQELKNLLERKGFTMKITKPIATNVINQFIGFFNNNSRKNKIGYVGFIHATKNI